MFPDQLLGSQEILNEWAVTISDIEPRTIWEIEQRFSTQYKNFFRFIYSKSREIKTR